ncbi:aminotransferase class V-fold PLP-dependent enzyme [Patescibacteria group bacterium]|nr:aminotransferase class V-fold PLP-dependent enzyme [Patescibacteria group bacterium]
MKPLIYLDHAAAAPLEPRVLASMMPYFSDVAGNPSSFHTAGVRAKNAVTEARQTIARLLLAHEDEILFCSGGTESDNMAVVGITRAAKALLREKLGSDAKPHVITTTIEHPAVLEPLLHLEKTGEITLTQLSVDRAGMVTVEEVEAALRPETVLVSIMWANNEIGTIEPIADIGRALLIWRKEHKTPLPFFHSDACQAAGACDLNIEKSHVDALTINGSKIYGPKGVGALFLRRGVKMEPLVRGGGQERNLRSGTENVPGIVGLASAFALVQEELVEENARLIKMRDRLTEGLLQIPKSRLNGHPILRLPNNVNISFLDMEGEAAALYLDAEGIQISTGSACASSSLDPSHVILATGLSYEAAHGSLRFTLGHDTTDADIDLVLRVMPGIVERLRAMSPVNLDMKYFLA